MFQYLRRIFHFRQMDFEFALWQMIYLLMKPQQVYRNFAYRKVSSSVTPGTVYFLCPVALHTALNRFMPIFQIALICKRFNLAGNYFT